ncbi:hypothetical protein J3R30DRAFT_3406123 [Lentinula aciculospora]|uniref:DUF6534 domain-containing protein n=1 Tax=Lentinula aciculospora TaxID=153920 RepID=A0A9W9DKL4_9AGAR|nr:hypothetical protein J3R30DRAFT_3406123 [Lentinula aciculospora]
MAVFTVRWKRLRLFRSPIAVFTEPGIWSLVTQVLVRTLSGSIVKICFVIRVWRFSHHNKVVTTVLVRVSPLQILTITLLQLIGSASAHDTRLLTHPSNQAFVIEAYQVRDILDIANLKVIGSTALVSGSLADFLIAVTLCYYLQKLRTGYKEPDSLLNSLVQYAMNTGALTRLTFQYMGVYFVLSKMFAVSLMCALRTRKRVTGEVGDVFTQTQGVTTNIDRRVEPYLLRAQAIQVGEDTSVELEIWDTGNQLHGVRNELVGFPTALNRIFHTASLIHNQNFRMSLQRGGKFEKYGSHASGP